MFYEETMTRALYGLQRKVTIMEYERGLLYQRGKFMGLLEPGHYTFWTRSLPKVVAVQMRMQTMIIGGQEMLTADNIDIRMTLVAFYRVSDPVLVIHSTENAEAELYQTLQLVLREVVTTHELDALLTAAGPLTEAYGIELIRVGVKDMILPGRMREVMLLEVEAERSGRADLIRARHETAAARARANTAKILRENPQIARMQEIEALATLAGGPGNLVLLPNLADLFRLNNGQTE